MKHFQKFTAVAVALVSMASCQKETNLLSTPEPQVVDVHPVNEDAGGNTLRNSDKHVYTLSNQVGGNAVIDFVRGSNGTLTYSASYATGGNGTGGGLGNQGAVILTDGDDDVLLAVNAGSNSISSFKVNGNGLQLRSTVNSGGMRPVSITQHDDIVYVLNAGGSGNISGFKLSGNKMLTPIPNSTRSLSSAASGAAQVSFVNDGKVVVITEKATNKIITYTVDEDGMPGAMHTITSSSPTPFGFADGKHGNIFVSEAVGGAPGASVLSSYHVSNNGTITLLDGSVGAGQSAACWVVITKNGKFAYTTNTASNNLSTFEVNNDGDITVSQAVSATTQAGPIDAALNNNSKYLYALNSVAHSIQVFEVANNGMLSHVQTLAGIPAGATGLAAK